MKKFSANELLEQSIAELPKVESGQVFTVKDLFKGYEWNNQEINTRLHLGTLFVNYANDHDSLLEILGKTLSGQQEYEKK